KGLSLFHEINQRSLLTATSLLFAVPMILAVILNRSKCSPSSGQRFEQMQPIQHRAVRNLKAAIRSHWFEAIAISYIGFVSLEAALLYASQIWDTYVYHLPMIANWLQQGSLNPWPTACLRQVTRIGGAEYQQLWVVGMPHVDLLVELPSIVAGAISMFF